DVAHLVPARRPLHRDLVVRILGDPVDVTAIEGDQADVEVVRPLRRENDLAPLERDVEGIDHGEARRQRGFPTEELVVNDLDLIRGGGRTAYQIEKSERKPKVNKNDCNLLISK